jgi:hypothetical protein
MMATQSMVPPPNNPQQHYMNHNTSPPDAYRQSNTNTPPPSNVSPTNYHANVRQLRQPRQPLYVPAALRPNEKLARPTDIPPRPRAPDTPPTSNDSSFDGAKADAESATAAPLEFPPGFQFGTASAEMDPSPHHLSRVASETLSLEELGDVTGMPTTAHWKPDESSNSCFVCKQSFTWYFRRHHCRRCGNLVCDYHIKHTIPLDQNARIHPDGIPSKACNTCFDDYKIIRKLHHSRANSIADSSSSSQGTAMPIPNMARKVDDVRIGSMARSEGGYNWSTF